MKKTNIMKPAEQRQIAHSIDSLIRWRKFIDATGKRATKGSSARLLDYKVIQGIRDEITREIMRIEGVLGDNDGSVRSLVDGETVPTHTTLTCIRRWVRDNATPSSDALQPPLITPPPPPPPPIRSSDTIAARLRYEAAVARYRKSGSSTDLDAWRHALDDWRAALNCEVETHRSPP